MGAAVAGEASERPCFLGVEHSLLGRRWEARLSDARQALALAQRLQIPELVGRILAGRGVELEAAEDFLAPSLRASLPDPSSLVDMDRAAERLAAAVIAGETVAVFGDYDVDGATSAALLHRYLSAVGKPPLIYVPDRLAEGYGPNAPALLRLKEQGASLVLTVDCGITAFEALEQAAEAGLDVLVIDHHKAEPHLPRASAVVNPNRLDDSSGQGQLAAVGVTFLLLVAVNRALRGAGRFSAGRCAPDLLGLLDLVALGTVCDVVPLTGLNRGFVAQGLKVMARRANIGLAALADVARLDERPTAFHAGFLLGPRINAGGRVGRSDLGVRLLSSEDVEAARSIARELDELNSERRTIEQAVLDQALAAAEAGPTPEGLVFVAEEGWHPGVIGIVAARLRERYNLPAMVIAREGSLGKGSGRSVPGIDLGSAVIAARQAGLLVNGGGHAMAAGLTVETGHLAELKAFLSERLTKQIAAIGYRPALGFDGVLQPAAADAAMMAELERIAPYGTGNAEPRFALQAVTLAKAEIVGGDHVRCLLCGRDGGRLKGIAFRAMDSALGEALLKSGGLPLHVAGKLRADTWQGREGVQFVIEDAAPA